MESKMFDLTFTFDSPTCECRIGNSYCAVYSAIQHKGMTGSAKQISELLRTDCPYKHCHCKPRVNAIGESNKLSAKEWMKNY
jgi:hypothetical protein